MKKKKSANREKLFRESISILAKAYQDGMLLHGNCNQCAIANLLAAKFQLSRSYQKLKWNPCWSYALSYAKNNPFTTYDEKLVERGMKELDQLEYSIDELGRIETAFEKVACFHPNDDPDGYKGLMAVIDFLVKLHNISRKEEIEIKAQFVKKPVSAFVG